MIKFTVFFFLSDEKGLRFKLRVLDFHRAEGAN